MKNISAFAVFSIWVNYMYLTYNFLSPRPLHIAFNRIIFLKNMNEKHFSFRYSSCSIYIMSCFHSSYSSLIRLYFTFDSPQLFITHKKRIHKYKWRISGCECWQSIELGFVGSLSLNDCADKSSLREW